MRTITKEIQLFKFNELNENAKEKALYDHTVNGFYPWYEENKNVLEKFEEIFPIKIKEYEYGYRNYIDFDLNLDYEEIEEFTGIRLLKYLYNNFYDKFTQGKYYSTKGYYDKNKKYHYKYKHSNIQKEISLTGYYLDHEILKPIIDFLNKPNKYIDLGTLMDTCLNNWIQSCNNDYEYNMSMECFEEYAEANDYDFTINGDLY